jgi:hypothetical protein
VWEGFDRVGDAKDPDRKIWMHGYIRQPDAPPADTTLSVADATQDVAAALSDIETFASANGSHFADVFAAARAALDQGASDQLDLVGFAGLGEDAARLLESAGRGWVFGGMGSWNDGAVGDPARYEEISERLYRSLIAGFVAVANATYRASDS